MRSFIRRHPIVTGAVIGGLAGIVFLATGSGLPAGLTYAVFSGVVYLVARKD